MHIAIYGRFYHDNFLLTDLIDDKEKGMLLVLNSYLCLA